MLKQFLLRFLCLFAICVALATAQAPDVGGRIVFVSDRDGHQNLWILDVSTGEARQITFFPDNSGISMLGLPRWSSDGKQILFSGYDPMRSSDRCWQAYLLNDDGSGLRQVTDYPGRVEYFQWYPTEMHQFICRLSLGWGNELYHRVNLITGEDITFPPSPDFYTSESSGTLGFDIAPSGDRMLFTRDVQYTYAYIGYQDFAGNTLGIVFPQTPGRVEMGRINDVDEWMSFHMAPGFPAHPPFNIYKADRDGNQLVPLTAGQGDECNVWPCWANGGNTGPIIFASNRYGNYELVTMEADGSAYPNGMRNLTNNPANDTFPDWTPYGYIKYSFEGFLSPIENTPTVNKANAGQVVSVKWRISDKNGLPVSEPASFSSLKSYRIDCSTFDDNLTNEVDEFPVGSSGLQYLGDGYWQFNWKTQKTYAGQCRIMKLTLEDNSEHTANFNFK